MRRSFSPANKKASANAPRSRGSAAATASAGERPFFISRVTRCATTSVSVSEPNFAPAFSSSSRSSRKFSMMPLWTTARRPVAWGGGVGGVGVGVALAGRAGGRPGGVPDADGAGRRLAREPGFEVAQLALGPPAHELSALQRGHAGGVVAPVFEPLERIDKQARDRFTPENTYNSAHASGSLLS